ncbi:putative ribonuclease H-like domain-containing protein [Tanacetum coccineum]
MAAIEIPQTLEYKVGQLNATPVLEDFQDNPDDEEDTKSSHGYLKDLEEKFQARALLAKSKRDCWSKTSVRSYQSPFQPKLLHSSAHKPEPRQTKDFEAKYKKAKEEVSYDENKVTEVKALMALANEERISISKESASNGEWVTISIQKCISEQIPTQKKKILGIDQLNEDTSTSGLKDPVFVKSSTDNSEVSITGSNKPKLSKVEDYTLSNHDTGKHPLSPLEKLTGVEPISGPKTIKSILKSKSTFKAKTLKGIIINEPSSAPARGNKSSSVFKTYSVPAGKLKNVKIEDDPPLDIVPPNALQNKYKTQLKMNCELCGQNNHLSKNCYEVLFCKKCKRTNHRTCDHTEFMSSTNINQYHTDQGESSSRSRPARPAIPLPSCIHYRYNGHKSDDCIYYPICEICGSYDHDTHGHNRIISLIRGIKPRNPQHVTKNIDTCGSNIHTTFDHNDIEWFRKREALQAKKVESFKASNIESSSALRSKTPTKRLMIEQYFQVQDDALWDVIENGNSFKLVAQTTTNADGTSTLLIPGPYKDAKTLFAAIQIRFGGNEATKKTQKTLLKQIYENFKDLNLKFLRSLPFEWNTHVVVWRNKPDLDTMRFDDLYNNFKIVEQKIKGTTSSSLNLSSQNMAFVSSPSSTNEVNTAYGVSTTNTQVSPASTQVSTASTQVSTTNLSDDIVYAFLASQPKRSQLVYEDLKKIHEDDIEEIDLKWQLALLSIRTRRFFQNTSRKITINGSDTAGYDKSKVECFNCHKIGYFARECRGPRNQDSRNRNQDSSRKTTLRIEFNKSEFNLATYKRGLASVEEQLVFYKKNEVIFCEQLAVLKRDISYKDSEISMLKSELEKLKQEKESNQLKIENFNNTSKSLDKLIGSQIPDKSKKGVGFVSYNAILPPPTGLFSPPNLDLSYSGLEEFQQPKFEGYGLKSSKNVSEDISNEVRKSLDDSLVEELVSDDKLEKKTVFPTIAKMEFVRPKQQENQLGNQLSMLKCIGHKVLGCFDHVQADCNYHQRERVVSGNNYTMVNYNYSAKKAHPSAHRNMVPRVVLMKTGLRSLNTARPVNTAHPKTIVYSARPIQKVNTAKGKFYTARPKAVNTTRPNLAVVNVVRENQGHPQKEHQGYVDSGCSRHMTGNMSYLSDFKEFDKGYVKFGGGAKGGKITGKGTLKTDETSGILKSFITEIENLVDKKVKIIKCDNGTNFKNRPMSEFHEKKGIKKEFSLARTPQQNGVAERRNKILIEAARTMLADSKLPTTFWAEAVNTACYVQNRVLVVKPHNKTPYEQFRGRTPALSFMRPFGFHVTLLNTFNYLGLFDGKSDEGFFIGYLMNSKAFRVYNIRIRKVEENLHIWFLEDKPIIAGDGPKWLFDIDILTKSINYVPVVAGTNSNDLVGTEESIGAGHSSKETRSSQDYILMPLWKDGSLFDSSSKNDSNDKPQPSSDAGKKDDVGVNKESRIDDQERPKNSTQDVNTAGPSINTASTNVNTGSLNINIVSPTVTTAPLEATQTDFFGDETELIMSNITTTYPVLSTPNTRIHKDYSLDHVIGDEEPKKVWTLVDLPHGKRAIGTKWVYKNKKDKRGIVIRNKARLVAQGYPQEEGIDYDEVFSLVARIEAIKLFLAYASFKDFVVYQMDVKTAFLYGKIEEEFYVCQPSGFEDPEFPNRFYKELCIEFEKLMHKKFQMSFMVELTFFLGLQVTQKDDGASTPMETSKPLMKDENAEDVDVYLYRSMIGSLMYLTSSRPDIIYLKGQPKLGLWYPKDSPFDLEAYTDSDYVGASLDRKSTTGGFQFLGNRLISWQYKKQTVVSNSTTEAEYVAAASCCGQVLWIQNQMLDYGYNFKNTKIFIDNESTIYIVKNPIFHSKTKHIEIRHHFIKDSNEKKLIQMIKIHTDLNVADLLIKAFDVSRFQYLIASKECLTSKVLIEGSAKTTAWNEFSSTMASAVICLATNQKFNFSKYIFDNMVKNLEGGVKVLMYLRFVQVFLDKQVERMTKHKEIYVTPSHTKKVFANMKRGGKGFSGRVTPLFQTMMVQAPEELEITKLKERVKKLERRNKSRTPRLKGLRKVGRSAQVVSCKDKGLGAQEDASKQGRKIADLDADTEITLVDEAQERSDDYLIATTTTVDELTLAQTLIEIKVAKPKAVTTAATTTTTVVTRPKARGVVVQEPKKEEKLAKQREEDANIAEWDNVQAMIDVDYELAKLFARLRAEEQRRKPPTKAQRRNQMCTYLKNMDGFTHSQLKNKRFDEVQKAFDKTMGWIDSFVSMDSEVVKGDDDQEEAEMKKNMEIVIDEEEIAVDAIPLATKPPIIVDWKISKE